MITPEGNPRLRRRYWKNCSWCDYPFCYISFPWQQKLRCLTKCLKKLNFSKQTFLRICPNTSHVWTVIMDGGEPTDTAIFFCSSYHKPLLCDGRNKQLQERAYCGGCGQWCFAPAYSSFLHMKAQISCSYSEACRFHTFKVKKASISHKALKMPLLYGHFHKVLFPALRGEIKLHTWTCRGFCTRAGRVSRWHPPPFNTRYTAKMVLTKRCMCELFSCILMYVCIYLFWNSLNLRPPRWFGGT